MTLAERYVEGAYAAANPTWHAEDSAWKAAQINKILSRNACQPKRIVEVGCGAGGVLSAVVEGLGSDAKGIGFDISPQAVSMAKSLERRNLQFWCADFIAHQEYRGYDLLLCIDVFEHIEDYIGFLKQIQPRSDYFVFHIPLDMNIRGLLRKHHMDERRKVGHIHYFDSMSALAALTDTGYQIVDHCYTPHPNPNRMMKSIETCRKLVSMMTGEDFSVQLLGGASLLVLARCPTR